MKILFNIIEKSYELREKVLVFSRSIPTLNYVEDLLKKYKMKNGLYAKSFRLDGN